MEKAFQCFEDHSLFWKSEIPISSDPQSIHAAGFVREWSLVEDVEANICDLEILKAYMQRVFR